VLQRPVRQTTVVGNQTRFTRCFRELEVASQQRKNSQNRDLFSFKRASLVAWLHHRWKKNSFYENCAHLLADLLNH